MGTGLSGLASWLCRASREASPSPSRDHVELLPSEPCEHSVRKAWTERVCLCHVLTVAPEEWEPPQMQRPVPGLWALCPSLWPGRAVSRTRVGLGP